MKTEPFQANDAKTHQGFMETALEQAREALQRGEFPVGCVLVSEGGIVADGARQGTAEGGCNETDHAEVLALKRLEALESREGPVPREGLVCYSTMEPCLMCFGALLINRVHRIVYAYEDVMGGGTGLDRSTLPPLYREPEVVVVPGILRKESLALFKAFWENPGNTYLRESLLARHTLSL